jgi:hypothetical protein
MTTITAFCLRMMKMSSNSFKLLQFRHSHAFSFLLRTIIFNSGRRLCLIRAARARGSSSCLLLIIVRVYHAPEVALSRFDWILLRNEVGRVETRAQHGCTSSSSASTGADSPSLAAGRADLILCCKDSSRIRDASNFSRDVSRSRSCTSMREDA